MLAVLCYVLRVQHCLSVYLCVRIYLCLLYAGLTYLWLYACSTRITLQFINKLFNSIACLLYFINLQLVIPGRTWILLHLGRTMYKCLWVCLALYSCLTILVSGRDTILLYIRRVFISLLTSPGVHPISPSIPKMGNSMGGCNRI